MHRDARVPRIVTLMFLFTNLNYTTSTDNSIQPPPPTRGPNIPGIPNIDYPTLASVPKTNFLCGLVQPGFYADPEAKCQVWHYCDTDGRQDSFLCPNGTLFNQIYLTCDWWYKVDCASASRAYLINADLYRPPPSRLRLPIATTSKF